MQGILMNKVVLITGCSSGMGKATALHLASCGFTVYAGSREPSKIASSKNLIPIFLDITQNETIDAAVQKIFKIHKRIDVLINNAGYGLISTVEDFDEKEMFNQFNINVFGLLRMSKSIIPIMRESNGGIIINISSFLGKIGLPLLTLYNASKYAVEGITDSLRYELSEFNIRVHSIMPGFFNTEFAKNNLVKNLNTYDEKSPYVNIVSKLAPAIEEEVNSGNDAHEVAIKIHDIIKDENFPSRVTVGDKAKKFIPMKKVLSDEDFERRVREYYGL